MFFVVFFCFILFNVLVGISKLTEFFLICLVIYSELVVLLLVFQFGLIPLLLSSPLQHLLMVIWTCSIVFTGGLL